LKVTVIGGGPAGLYFALLMKKSRPDADIRVLERNPEGVTWGWGVVFSDETLGHFRAVDRESHDEILASFTRWDAIDLHFRGRRLRSGGHSFCGIRRQKLLDILTRRARALGVEVVFQHDVTDMSTVVSSDLVVAADGVNSRVRNEYAAHFEPEVEFGTAKFVWLGSTKLWDTFTFIIKENEHGLFQVHAYRFDQDTSTFIVECDEQSWRNAGLDHTDEAGTIAYCERLFAEELDGARLLGNASVWRNFPRVRNRSWYHRNIVLLGDAAHTAHFSIGSGTKLAMEDAIALVAAFERNPRDVTAALENYQDGRWLDVAKLQRAAAVSRHWFEDIARYREMEPEQLFASLLSRSKRITHENLAVRDPAYGATLDEWFARANGWDGSGPVPPPMFVPFRLRGLELANRVVVSPMCMYSARDGTVGDWHLVHLGSRAQGGAGLVMTEMTDVSRDGRISPGCAGLYLPEHDAAWARIVDFVHAHTPARIGIQLGHAGRKGSTQLLWERPDLPLPDGNWPLLAPSPIPYRPESQVPREMTREDMVAVRDAFAQAARRARRIGFDLLELHCAHGYLLGSFISPVTNLRTDVYGGALAHRMRFPLEVLEAVREAWGDAPISVRISAHDWVPGGMEPAEAVEVAVLLARHGADIVDVSSGQTTPEEAPVYGRMFQTPFSDRIRHEAKVATIAVGNIQTWDHVNTIVVSGRADLCALARPHLYDPYFTLHAAAEQAWHPQVSWPIQYRSQRAVSDRIAAEHAATIAAERDRKGGRAG
jgi:anthraniloyl-CoA monooxygenase